MGRIDTATVLGLAVLTLCACSPQGTKFEASRNVRTSGGKEVRIARYALWDNFCTPRPVTVVTKTAPQHGTLAQRPDKWVIAESQRVGAIDCSGKTAQGIAVFYTPAPGYRGTDFVALSTQTEVSGLMSDSIAIRVE
jgi:hypothetical protein